MTFPKRFVRGRSTTHEILVRHVTPRRIDAHLAARFPDLSRTLLQRFVREGRVKVNGRTVRPSTKVRRGDRIVAEIPHLIRPKMIPKEAPLDILYEDEHLIALNKPPGMVMHPSTGHREDTLVNAVVAHLKIPPEATDVVRPGIVHRLDKDTSGVVLMGKSNTGLAGLARQFRERSVEKEYRAIVHGRIRSKEGRIELPIDRHRKDPKKMGVAPTGRGKTAVSRYRVLEVFPQNSYVAVVPETGRMHQIRVHLASLGHPCVGDPLYAGQAAGEPWLPRQALHAYRLVFRHPASGAPMKLMAPLPPDMQSVLEDLRLRAGRVG